MGYQAYLREGGGAFIPGGEGADGDGLSKRGARLAGQMRQCRPTQAQGQALTTEGYYAILAVAYWLTQQSDGLLVVTIIWH